ncbi:hypothetical protein Tco_0998035 [Tanacetum coccineum]
MSDSEDSTVTYTAVSSPFGGLSDFGSSRVNGPPVMPEDPYAYVVAYFQAPLYPDCVSGPVYPPSPDFVLKSVYSEFMPPKDEVLLAEEKPLLAVVSPITDSPGYVLESDPEEDPEEDDDEDPEEDLADYLADGRDDGDAEDGSFDDEDDDDALSAEETGPFETNESMATPPPHPAYYVTAWISIRDEPPIPFWPDTKVVRLLAIPTPPPSPLSPWSSPLPQIPSLPLPVLPLPTSPNYPLGYRAAMIRLRAEALCTSYSPLPHITRSHTRADTPPSRIPPVLPIPLPTSLLPLHLLSTDHRADRPKVTLPPQKRLNIALGLRYKVGESSFAPTARPPGGFRADYGFVSTMDREIMQDLERCGSTTGSDYRVIGNRPQETSGDYRDAGSVTAALAARDAGKNTNSNDSHILGAGVRRTERTARECTYTDFLKCQPLNFKGTEGVVGLSQWFERMKFVFHISNFTVENQVKFATCTLHSVALIWWNTYVKTVDHDATYEMEIWDLKVKGTNLTSYTQRFQELALLCGRIFPAESDKIEKYVGGLPDMIHGSVVASKPKTMQGAVEITTELIDKKICTFAERQT